MSAYAVKQGQAGWNILRRDESGRLIRGMEISDLEIALDLCHMLELSRADRLEEPPSA